MVKTLLYKDARSFINNLNKGKSTIFLFLFMYFVFLIFGEIQQAAMMMNIFLFSLIVSVYNLDDESQAEKYLNASPIGKSEIVKSKFLSILLMGIVSFIVNSIVFLFIKNFKGYSFENYIEMFATQIVILAIYVQYIPIIFKYGTKKSMVPFLIVIISITAIVALGIFLFIKLFPNGNFSDLMVSTTLMVVAFLLVGISYIISIKILENKEY